MTMQPELIRILARTDLFTDGKVYLVIKIGLAQGECIASGSKTLLARTSVGKVSTLRNSKLWYATGIEHISTRRHGDHELPTRTDLSSG
jgi:hypothetical protein